MLKKGGLGWPPDPKFFFVGLVTKGLKYDEKKNLEATLTLNLYPDTIHTPGNLIEGFIYARVDTYRRLRTNKINLIELCSCSVYASRKGPQGRKGIRYICY